MITRRPYTYYICLFNRVCQLFLLSEVYKTGSKRYKTRQLWGTSPPISFNKHIKKESCMTELKPLLHLPAMIQEKGKGETDEQWQAVKRYWEIKCLSLRQALTRTERQMENFYSSYPNPEGEGHTLRMDQLCMPPSGGQGKQERERDEERIWQRINIF